MAIERIRERAQNHSDHVPAAVLGVPGVVEILRIDVPAKCRARITEFGNYLGTVAAWGIAYWEYEENGVRREFAGNIRLFDQIGYAAQRQKIDPIDVPGGTSIAFYGYNPTAAILDMGISIAWQEISKV